MPQLSVVYRPVGDLIPYARNSRTHSDAQVAQIAGSIREFGFTSPVLIDEAGGIIAGHGRVLAARKLGMAEVPTIALAGLSEAQKRAYVIADNKLALNAGWDEELLKVELQDLTDAGLDIGVTGWSPEELNVLFNGWQSDIDVVDKHGENTDGISGVVKIKVAKGDEEMAKEAITNALDAAGVEYEFA